MNYGKYERKAAEKIRQYGSPVTVTSSAGQVYDREHDTYANAGKECTGFALQGRFDQRNVDGTNIRIGDILLICSLDGVPRSNDTVTFGGKRYVAVSVEPLSPDGKTAIYYRIQAR